jgi:heparan-alpha-glucosaminide N-acetyltransferase
VEGAEWISDMSAVVNGAAASTAEIPMVVEQAKSRPAAAVAPRNVAVDAYRGLVMLLMMAEVLRFSEVAKAFPGNWFWSLLAWNQTHTEWVGCSLHDTIQPGFSFLVGVALPYSIASRIAKGKSFGEQLGHAFWRAFVLIILGFFLRSMYKPMTYFTFEDTLTQIGCGYVFLFLLGYVKKEKWLWVALGGILFGYWLAWALYPVAGPGFDWQAVGVSADWAHAHNFSGFMAHWNKNANFGNRFDQWFLNLFPRTSPFVANDGGYLTLSFIPTLGTMILGLIAGRWLRAAAPAIPFKKLLMAGAGGLAAGLLLHAAGICPIVKRIWTPSWTLFSGGICFLFLAAFCWVIEAKGYKKWAFPLIVIGMNSMAAYLIAHLTPGFIFSTFRTHLGANDFAFGSPGLQPFFEGAAVLGVFWLMLYWMYKRKIFLRI